MYKDRIGLIRTLEALRQSRVLLYVTGDRPGGLETQIHSEVLDYFVDHLDTFGLPTKISLFLYSRGGETLAGWSIVNLIRHFCDEFEVIIPSKAHSTATLIALGADGIVMTKQATLGPIDPSINSPFNPQFPGGQPNQRIPVSVEAVAGYLDLARTEGIVAETEIANVFARLATEVHPLALGAVFRARAQIQRLADRLLRTHMDDDASIKHIISVLSSESGSHDYTINRREALSDLRLPVVKPDDEFYSVIRDLHSDVRAELQLNERFDPAFVVGDRGAPTGYSCTRALLESLTGGSHRMINRGTITPINVTTAAGAQPGFMNQTQFEGWEHEASAKP
jgi:hypothetical protein